MRVMSRLLAAGFVLGATVALLDAQDAPRVYTADDGVSLPVVVTRVNPQYTREAMDAGIEGTVALETVVLENGTVADVSVTRSLDPLLGLDEQAIKALEQWKFRPGAKDGKPVRVRVHVEMTFTLK